MSLDSSDPFNGYIQHFDNDPFNGYIQYFDNDPSLSQMPINEGLVACCALIVYSDKDRSLALDHLVRYFQAHCYLTYGSQVAHDPFYGQIIPIPPERLHEVVDPTTLSANILQFATKVINNAIDGEPFDMNLIAQIVEHYQTLLLSLKII